MSYLGSYASGAGYSYYAPGGDQRHTRAPFLIVASDAEHRLYGCVRKVALQQVGHFMMGRARVGGQTLVLSGPYGGDGLPIDYGRLSERARRHFVRLPSDLEHEFWQGGGHNSSGPELPAMLSWARAQAGARP